MYCYVMIILSCRHANRVRCKGKNVLVIVHRDRCRSWTPEKKRAKRKWGSSVAVMGVWDQLEDADLMPLRLRHLAHGTPHRATLSTSEPQKRVTRSTIRSELNVPMAMPVEVAVGLEAGRYSWA